MRVAFVIEGIAGGGLERRTVNIVNELSKRPQIDVVLLTGKMKENEYVLLPIVKRKVLLTGKYFKDMLSVKKYAKSNEVDIVVGMGIYANLLVCFMRCLCRIKTIVVEANDPRSDNLSYLTKLLRKLFYQKSDGYIFQTNEERDFYAPIIQNKSVVIHNPVKKDLPFRDKKRDEIVAVGRLVPQKNYELLLRAFKEVIVSHPEYTLSIYGEGREEPNIREFIRVNGLNNSVNLCGFCENVHEKIRESDIYILTSNYEGMPNALLEAMAMGFPVISTECGGGGAQELIKNGINGLLVPKNKVKCLTNSIKRLIENPKEKELMGERAKEIRNEHSIEVITNQWCSYFDSLIDNVGPLY